MHGEEQKWVDDAIRTNWVSTVGANINEVEKQIAEYVGCKYAVALSAGTASLHLATKLAGERLYGQARPNQGTLQGHRVFCSDCTFDASINPVAYEDGEAVFIDTERDTWNMDPVALKKAFEIYPDVKLVVIAHLYGTPGKIDEIRAICDDGMKYKTASVCIPASYVKAAKEYVGDNLKICTVIGFPNGYSTAATKVFEAKEAIRQGASEIDMVVNLCDVKNGNFDRVYLELLAMREACEGVILKVIIETCQLKEEEKIKMCELVSKAKADFIKTSTGFSTGGATVEDVALLRKYSAPEVKVKAAGGIKDFSDAKAMIEAGADRLGTSRLVK